MVYKKPTGKHRKVWEQTHNKKIPKGYAVHHIDMDTSNNHPDNLELVHRSKHQSDHNKERLKDPDKMKELLENLKKAQKKATEWHKSDDGRLWHKEHYKNSLANANKYEYVCIQCDNKYFSTRLKVTRFCHHRCSQNYYAKKRREVKNAKNNNISNGCV